MANIFKIADNLKFAFNKILWTWSCVVVLFFPYMFEKFKKLCFGGCFLLGELDSEAFLVRDKDIWKSTEHSVSCTAVKAAFRWKHFFSSGTLFCIHTGVELMSIISVLNHLCLWNRYKAFNAYFSLLVHPVKTFTVALLSENRRFITSKITCIELSMFG